MCGEKTQNLRATLIILGSPPHVRGKVLNFGIVFTLQGITPACAGKSTRAKNSINANLDHPRMCGEKTKKIP